MILLKDKRTRRKRVPTEVSAALEILEGPNAGKWYLPVEVNSEGGVDLVLTELQTKWFEPGEYGYDLVVTISTAPLFTSTNLTQTRAVYGTLTVEDNPNITPMAVDSEDAEPLEAVA